jgi:threonine dehydrogenase-like Zn-dependent dehydrogenase
MKAVVCQNTELSVRELPEPVPARGQVLIEVLRCGICGSDLHLRHHCNSMKKMLSKVGVPSDIFPSAEDPIVFGHEFCGEVLEFGADCKKKLKLGTRVVSQPVLRVGDHIELQGLTTGINGAYAERMLMQEVSMLPVPNGLSTDMAALTEPMAVAFHAVRRSEIKKKDVAIVIGCGPVGLSVICLLKSQGVAVVVASDFSPGRRALAKQCGADVVINPAETSPYSNWKEYGHIQEYPALLELGMSTVEQLSKLPLPWWHMWRLAEKLGAADPKRPVIFECVGMPGLLQQVIEGSPLMSRVIVVGVCMPMDNIEPALAIQKEVDLRFVLGHTPLEFRDTLHLIADGKVNCQPMLTGVVGLNGVENAFAALGDPEMHAKILIDPKSSVTTPVAIKSN